MSAISSHPDVHDYREHPCGCATYFDLSKWGSVAVVRCGEHEEVSRG